MIYPRRVRYSPTPRFTTLLLAVALGTAFGMLLAFLVTGRLWP